MTALLWLTGAIFFLLASGFFSGTEMGLYCLNRLRVRLRAQDPGYLNDRMLAYLADRPQETVLAILLGTNLANYLLTVTATMLLVDGLGFQNQRADFYIAAILAPMVFVFGDVVPKNWYQIETERLMGFSAGVLRGSVLVFKWTGILWILHTATKLLVRLSSSGKTDPLHSPRTEVIGLLREGGARGALTEEQTEIIERVMNLSTIRVGSIMVPRRRLVTVPVDADRPLFERIVNRYPYSRLLVTGRDRKSIIGAVNVHTVLADPEPGAIERCIWTPITVPASASATTALIKLQQAERTMALVTDPRRGYVGMITLKDIVEEIFGELPAW